MARRLADAREVSHSPAVRNLDRSPQLIAAPKPGSRPTSVTKRPGRLVRPRGAVEMASSRIPNPGGLGLPDVRDYELCLSPTGGIICMHVRAMYPGSHRARANVRGRASLGALTKAQMAERLVDEVGLNRREAGEIVEQFFDEIADVLAANEPVKLSRFGNFTPRDKGERPGRNPKTGETIPIAAGGW